MYNQKPPHYSIIYYIKWVTRWTDVCRHYLCYITSEVLFWANVNDVETAECCMGQWCHHLTVSENTTKLYIVYHCVRQTLCGWVMIKSTGRCVTIVWFPPPSMSLKPQTKSPRQTSQTATTTITLSHPHKHTFQRFVSELRCHVKSASWVLTVQQQEIYWCRDESNNWGHTGKQKSGNTHTDWTPTVIFALLFLSLTYISVFLVKQEHYNTKWGGKKAKNNRKHVNQQKLLQNINWAF